MSVFFYPWFSKILSRNHRTIVDVRIYIFTRIRSTSKTKLNYIADIVPDRKDTTYTPQSIPKSFALAIIGCRNLVPRVFLRTLEETKDSGKIR